MRRGMYSGTFAIPVTRPSVEAVWRVFVSDHSASPVIARSLRSHTSGAAAASSVRPSELRRALGQRPALGAAAQRGAGTKTIRYSQ